ncbi:uncharacterized protein LOC120346540 [Styela clava]
MSRNCRKPPACTVDGCRLKHNTLLHRKEQETCTQTENAAGMHESKVEAYATSKSSAGCFFNIVPVKICANRREIETYAFLDEGSTACLCDERLLDLLKLRGKKTQFSLTTVNAVQTSQDGYAVDFTVKSLDGRESVDLSHVLTVDRLPVKANEAQFDVQSYAHLKGLKIPTLPCKDVMLMIGVNVPKVFWSMDERRGKHNEPSAKKSILGWSLVGPALSYERNSDVHIHCVQVQEKDLLSQQIKCLWESDFKDASLSPIPSMSKEDKYALQLMEDSVEIVDGHYQLPLSWKPGCPDLPDNRSVAMKRLKYIERKLKSDPVLKKKYCDTMEKYISLGFAKRIPNEYKVGRKGAVWYLPHHPVFSEQKPGKERVVFDAASRCMNTSLNDQLLRGPDSANSLLGTLLRFRQPEIAIVADIEAMFYQVKVHPKDWNVLRFMWWPGGDLSQDPSDILWSAKWKSSNPEVLSEIPAKDRADTASSVNLIPEKIDRVLGIKWNIQEDCFGFDVNVKSKPATKRGILSVLSSIFDPMGIVAPVILKARILMQQLCRNNYGWDDEISNSENLLWNRWLEDIPEPENIFMQRCFAPSGFGNIVTRQIHHFADGSAVAYGTVSYLRLINEDGTIHVAFLLGKAQLASIKTVSIPRLELTAAALAVKLDLFLRRELDFEEIESMFWTDSTSWRYVPTDLNPADDASRGLSVQSLMDEQWLNGPSFLQEQEEHWPKPPVQLPELPDEFLKKASAWMIRFKDYLHKKKKDYKCNEKLEVEELRVAGDDILKYIQRQEFGEVIDAL